MRTADLLSLSTRMFKTRPMRTFLTVFGVGVGIGTVLFLVSLGYGLQYMILNRIATADSLLTLDVNPGPSPVLALTDRSKEALATIPHVVEVSRQKNIPAQLSIGRLTGNAQVSAVDENYFRLRGITASHGTLYENGNEFGALISSAGARLFNLPPEEILGKEMDVTLLFTDAAGDGGKAVRSVRRAQQYVITGVVDDASVSYIYVPLSGMDDLAIDIYDQMKVKVESSGQIPNVRDAILARGYVVSALSDTIDQANKVFSVVQIVLALFGLVALGVSAIGMFNTMTITLLERTNEIGIMRAIGIAKSDIRRLFLTESILMGFLGGVFGLTIGVVGGFITNIGVNLLSHRFGGPSMQLFYVPSWFVGVILSFSVVVGFLTGVYPAFRASRLNPLDALRYK
jgi:putative ABC transport system permease protein